MTKDGYEAYKLYLALQRHFSTNYDFFKYHGKVNASTEAYSKRPDMYSFEKLTKIVLKEDLEDFFIAHFLENPKCWIKSMSKSTLDRYQAQIKNFSTTFRDDLEKISQFSLPGLMTVENDIPQIHKLVISNSITIETVIAIDKFYPFIDRHNEQVKISFVWPDYIDKIVNYRPFFVKHVTEFHKDIMKDVLLNK